MSDDVLNNAEEVVETVEAEQELVENEEILDEETLEEAKHDDDEEVKEMEDEDEEEVKEEAPQVEIPKTKAGVIQAAVDMLKKANATEAKKLYAQLIKIDGEEDSLKT
jgi:hypothetical protein